MSDHSSLEKAGAIFDLDGVLIDSHDQHQESWFMLAEELGRPLTVELFKESFGMRNERVIPHVFHWAGEDEAELIHELGERKEKLYRQCLRTGGLDPLPGVVDLLEALGSAGIPCVVGSSTSRKNIEVCLEMTGLDRFFGDCYTGAEDVQRGKPDPDVFLEAARKIDRNPDGCFVVEDAHVGVQAARAGGMRVIAVTTTHPAGTFTGDSSPDVIVASLEEVTLDTIRPWFS